MTVRRLGPGDERHAAFFGGDPARFLANDACLLYAAFDGDDAVGWAYGHELPHPDGTVTLLVYSLDVAEHARRRGHGRALVAAMVEAARERGCTEAWVLTDRANAAARGVYEAAGGVLDPGDTVMYVWDLR